MYIVFHMLYILVAVIFAAVCIIPAPEQPEVGLEVDVYTEYGGMDAYLDQVTADHHAKHSK